MTGTRLSANELDALEADLEMTLGRMVLTTERRRELAERVAAIREKAGLPPVLAVGTPDLMPSVPPFGDTEPRSPALHHRR